ncbi:placenta-specific protein 9-like [Amblyraja radiata]|uniref:placenta-specific protein 9-like n=1 Tax=Amblyraja radiata TaxID=386614 RepID=UPI00140331BC|nr:placenta-specific protein 9-like [Amblyraja radiata]
MRAVWVLAGILVSLGAALAGLEQQRDDTNWCEHDKAVYRRLDIIETSIDQTVSHLEAEVSDLLSLMEASTISLPSGSPTIDIFESGV